MASSLYKVKISLEFGALICVREKELGNEIPNYSSNILSDEIQIDSGI